MKKLLIIIPMAGAGSRFKKLYKEPKPLIDIKNKKMVEIVIENLLIPNRDLHFIFIIRQEHQDKYNINSIFEKLANKHNFTYTIKILNTLTEGSLCSILKARKEIEANSDENLLIANVDQFLDWKNGENFIEIIDKYDYDGCYVVTYSDNPKWSYCSIDYNTGFIKEVKEKVVLSNIANTGLFFFKKGKEFLEASDDCINRNLRVANNEFYTSIIVNYLIYSKAQNFIVYPLSNNQFWGLGDPESLNKFILEYKGKF